MEIKKQVEIWLMEKIGLSLLEAKTKIINSVKGFQFLGFQIISINIKASKQYKYKVYPSKASKKKLTDSVRNIIQQHRSISSYHLIKLLRLPIVRWINYFQIASCYSDFAKLDYLIFQQIRAWVFRRVSKGLRSRAKLKQKYFSTKKIFVLKNNKYFSNWTLVGKNCIKDKTKENFLPKMVWIYNNLKTSQKKKDFRTKWSLFLQN
jgi:RNA-directed DNA polymerase